MREREQADELNFLPVPPRDCSVPIGCIGSGFIMSDCHLVSYRQQGLNPVAIASRNPEHARAVAARHALRPVVDVRDLLRDSSIPVIDIAVPPDIQPDIIRAALEQPHIRGILAQKPLAVDYRQARELVEACEQAGVVLAVNQNMRYDQSVRACQHLLTSGRLGDPVFATIEMRAIPHWAPWQRRLHWLTLRIMSIHHLDTFRYWFGTPERVFASLRTDPRTARDFPHDDGICSYILEYASGLRACGWDDVWAGPAREGAAADLGIRWRVEGTSGLARGTIGWPEYPQRSPSTLDYSLCADGPTWQRPRWKEVWFPDAFAGPMCELLQALEEGKQPHLNGRDNLETMALVDACYQSAREHRAIPLAEILNAP
ncbi:MAG: Gfo/Idh/MocA family oxidoreductase [Planctomycetaceae bacterium]|nr:Gfo/Idh/MocA family oxidoreductase [Planctomycetaceae bacterium]